MSTRGALMFGAVALVGFAFLLLLLEGCRPADVPRETARAAVLATSEGVRVAGDACAAHALTTRDLELARACAAAYDAARLELVTVAVAVDAWDTADRGALTCAIRNASSELGKLAHELEAKGGRPPPIVADAFRLVSALAPCADGGAR